MSDTIREGDPVRSEPDPRHALSGTVTRVERFVGGDGHQYVQVYVDWSRSLQ